MIMLNPQNYYVIHKHIRTLYLDEQKAINILRGVRRIISPLIFKLYSEEIFKEDLKNCENGIFLTANS